MADIDQAPGTPTAPAAAARSRRSASPPAPWMILAQCWRAMDYLEDEVQKGNV